jgi:hypothetical protein
VSHGAPVIIKIDRLEAVGKVFAERAENRQPLDNGRSGRSI